MLTKFLKFYSEKFSKFLQEDGWFVFLLLILNLPILIQEFFFGTEIRSFSEKLSNGIVSFYLGAVVILIFSAAVY